MILVPLLAVPLFYVALLVYLARRGDSAGIGLSIIFFAMSLVTGGWTILQSRSSTAGIGFLFLPLVATVTGLLGLAYSRLHSSPEVARKVLGWSGLLAAVLINLSYVREGVATRSRNASRDALYAAHTAAIDNHVSAISQRLQQNPGQARAFLDSSILANRNDRAFLLAALRNDSISATLLDTLVNHADGGVALTAVNNPATRAASLKRIYSEKNYPDYFYQALAAHHNSPPEVLRGIYRNPGVMSNLDIWFAGNPSTPRDVLQQISRSTTNRDVIRRMLENPAIDCGILGDLGNALLKRLKSSGGDESVARMTELLPTFCPVRKP